MGIVCIGVPLLIVVGLIIMALVRGIRLVRASNQHAGSAKTTLRLLALNMIEPAINTIMIAVLFNVFVSRSLVSSGFVEWFGMTGAILVTLPMMVLLLPFVWARSPDPVCATINTRLGLLGIIRWGITAITFIFPYTVLVGIGVLWFSYSWVQKQAPKLVRYQAIGVGPDGVMVGDLSDFSQSPQPDIRV